MPEKSRRNLKLVKGIYAWPEDHGLIADMAEKITQNTTEWKCRATTIIVDKQDGFDLGKIGQVKVGNEIFPRARIQPSVRITKDDNGVERDIFGQPKKPTK